MKWLRPLFVFTVALALPACQGSSSGTAGKPKVAFVSNNPTPFWTIAEAGCRKAEGEFGVEVVFKKPASGDPALQTELIDNVRSLDVKAIAVSVIDPKGQKPHLNEIAAKIPLITQDNDAPDSNRLCYIGTNNYLAGRAVGQLVKEALPDGGAIAVFVGDLAPLNARQRRQRILDELADRPVPAVFVGNLALLNARQRRQGMLDELADRPAPANINEFKTSPDKEMYGKYRLHATYTDQLIGEQKATQNATEALTDLLGEKHIGMIGIWAYNPPTILTAVQDKVKSGQFIPGQVKIIGFDEDFATLQGIEDGLIHGTIVQDQFNFGYEAVRMMASLAKGDKSVLPANRILYVPHRVITKEGGKDRVAAAPFRKELEKNLGKDK